MKRTLVLLWFAVLLFSSSALLAQSGPTVYTYVASNKFVGDLIVHAQRDGGRAMVQLTSAKDPTELNVKNYYDFTAHRIYTLDLNAKNCSTVGYTSPYPPPLNDVVAMGDDLGKEFVKAHAQSKPGEPIAGLATKIYEMSTEDMAVKVWVDDKYNIPMRYILTPKGGKPNTLVEVSEIKFTAAPAATFAFPTGCTQLKGSTDANGGHVETN